MGSDFDLFSSVAMMAAPLHSLYTDNRFGRADLLEFMDANAWFGAGSEMGMTPCAFEEIRDPLTLWLSAYKKPGREKIKLMLEYFSGIFPVTCRLYREFVAQNCLENMPSAWKLLDYLLSEIDREITEYDELGIAELARRLDAGATLQSARLFSEFLQSARHNGRPLTKWAYTFHSRGGPELVNDAYPVDSFAVMAYCTFNKDMWERQELVGKATKSPVYADLWLFTALHFICALRPGDMARLPAPALPCDGATVLKRIASDTFPKSDAAALSDELCVRLRLKPMRPSKTSAHKKVPALKLFIPESLREPLGTIMAISLAHRPEIKPGDGFISSSCKLGTIRAFFGGTFADALENRRLSSRRCNKSYLQGIDLVAGNDNAPGKPKGYMLAALARSHKGGIGSLAKTTDVYLKDARFSGYSPEFIIREMFERGVFSFIPAVLLEMYAGSDYTMLPAGAQTKLICEIGLSSHQIERVADAVERAMARSKQAVNSVLRDCVEIHERIFILLQNIACGNAPGKQEECLCLLTAAGLPCAHAGRERCIGCGYEIYTKTAMHTLMKEYARLSGLRKVAEKSDVWRYEKIMEHAVLPAISELLSAARILYKGVDTSGLLDIVERGLANADNG